MKPREYHTLYAHEEHHWWFLGTRAVIFAALEEALQGLGPGPHLVLDVGCGTGGTLARLPQDCVGYGIEESEEALRFCAMRGLDRVQQGRAEALPWADGTFHAVLALDVLEHIPNHEQAARELRRVLVPGGVLVCTVPAHPWLWSEHDVALHHVRRYRAPELRALLQSAGFGLRRLSYYNAALFPAVAAVRLLQRLGPERPPEAARSDVKLPPRPLNALLAAVLGAERHVLRRADLPIGVSLLAVGEASATAEAV
jgi:SAM-dependent methyltransferase